MDLHCCQRSVVQQLQFLRSENTIMRLCKYVPMQNAHATFQACIVRFPEPYLNFISTIFDGYSYVFCFIPIFFPERIKAKNNTNNNLSKCPGFFWCTFTFDIYFSGHFIDTQYYFVSLWGIMVVRNSLTVSGLCRLQGVLERYFSVCVGHQGTEWWSRGESFAWVPC